MYTLTIYRSVPQIRPPFCNLSLSAKRRGGAYARDAMISLAITPSLPVPVKQTSLSVGGGGQAGCGEMLPTLQVG